MYVTNLCGKVYKIKYYVVKHNVGLFPYRAAHHLWGGSIYEYQCIDSSQEMGQLAEALRCGRHDLGCAGQVFKAVLVGWFTELCVG